MLLIPVNLLGCSTLERVLVGIVDAVRPHLVLCMSAFKIIQLN